MEKLWFNQTGDEIDKFSETGDISISHDFGFDNLPSQLKWNEDTEHCEFLHTERQEITSKMNFAATQEEIDGLYDDLELLDELGESEQCV